MGRLNYRLIFSLLAAGAVLLTLLIPATRPLTQRKFWLLSGTYLDRIQIDHQDYTSTSGMTDDRRIALLLRGHGRLSVEERSFELAQIATQRKNAALWGHVIRQTAAVPIPTNPYKSLDQANHLRRETIAHLQLMAALEGQKLAPENAFFYLSEATALARLGRWDEILTPLEKGAKLSQFDDYTLDLARRQLEQLYQTLNPVLPSDLGGDWSMILMPHLSNYRSLCDGLGQISSERQKQTAALALAQIGETIVRSQDNPIMKYGGNSMVARSLRASLGLQSGKDKNASSLVPKAIAKAETLGLAKVAAGWEPFRDWQPYQAPSDPDIDTAPLEISPMTAIHALFILAWIAAIGAGLWVGSQLEPNFVNILTGVGVMLGVTSLGFGLVEQPWLLVGWNWGSILIFCSFATLRLPGKRLASMMVSGLVVVLMLVMFIAQGDSATGLILLALWLAPFMVAQSVKWTMPSWIGLSFVSIVLGGSFAIVGNGMPSTLETFERFLGSSVQTLLLVTVLGIPLIASYVMAFAKLNLSDALRLMLRPIPFFALVAAGIFLWGMREEMKLQAVWTELSERTLPPSYKRVIEEVRGSQ